MSLSRFISKKFIGQKQKNQLLLADQLIWLTALLMLFYMTIRFFIYSRYSGNSSEDWAYRDIVMSIPRLICLILVLWLQKLNKLDLPTSLNLKGFKFTIILGGLFLVLIQTKTLFVYTIPLQTDLTTWVVLGSVCVGFFEEGLFRGLFFDTFKKYSGSLFAIFASSVLFMVFHFQAQEWQFMPSLFLFGVIFALLRDRGVSLLNLATLHAAYDVISIFYSAGEMPSLVWFTIELLYLFAICAGFSILTRPSKLQNS